MKVAVSAAAMIITVIVYVVCIGEIVALIVTHEYIQIIKILRIV